MIKSTYFFFLCLVGILLASPSCKKDDDDSDVDCSTVKFSTEIAPLLANSCTLAGCHEVGSPDGDYTTYAGIETRAKDGTVRQSVLVDKTMPKAGNALSQTQLDDFKCWLDAGAPDN